MAVRKSLLVSCVERRQIFAATSLRQISSNNLCFAIWNFNFKKSSCYDFVFILWFLLAVCISVILNYQNLAPQFGKSFEFLFEWLQSCSNITVDKPRGRGRPLKDDYGERRPQREGGNRENAPRERRERSDRPERFGDRFGERADRPQNEFRYML